MPIEYGPSSEWPPKATAAARKRYDTYAAWYSGDAEALIRIYGSGAGSPLSGIPKVHPSQMRGGFIGALARFWWGRPLTAQQGTARIHVPAPADLATYSADLLYGEPLSLTLPTLPPQEGAKTEERLSVIMDEGGTSRHLLEGGETSSAFGGAFIRAAVDKSLADMPLTDVLWPDVAIPEYAYDQLRAVTFWRQIGEPDGQDRVFRHLERHEVIPGATPDAPGTGVIYHALYFGTTSKLGGQVPLESHPETARYALLVNDAGYIETGASILDVVYVPNVLPQRLPDLRGSALGRSDYDGIEGFFDGLDEVWSSLLRDFRLAKARLVVPRAYLQASGRGEGGYFDAEQEIFTAVDMLGGPERGMELSQVQFSIRVDEHLAGAAAHWRTIMRSAGLSQDAFGEEVDRGGATAKEIGKRGERTMATRKRKIGYAKPAIQHLAEVLLQLDRTHFGTDITPAPVKAEWPAIPPDPQTQAQTIQLLDAAGAISTYLKVKMQHPAWSETEIMEEVDRINESKAAGAVTLQDPGTFTGAGEPPSSMPPDGMMQGDEPAPVNVPPGMPPDGRPMPTMKGGK